MAITLRQNTSNNTGKGSELTYLEMDTNLESYYYSSSYASGILYLHTTGSDTHSIDLSGFVDDLETGSLVRVSAFNTATGSFVTNASTALNVITFTKGDGTTFNVTVDTGSATGGSTDYVSTVALNGTSLDFTGVGSAFNSSVDLSSLAGGSTDITALNTFTGSAQTSITALNGATGSYVYSGSFDGVDTITLYSEDTNYTLDLGALAGGGSGVQPSETGSFYYSSSVNLNTITFFQGDGTPEIVTVNTGSTAPGGSDTQVQFNDGGSTFGGDSGFTYNKTANRVTITAPSSPTRTAPNLLLNSEIANVALDEVFGVIAANNTTDQYSPASYPASIQFTADTTFGPGNYDTRIGLFVNNNASETEALRLRSSGQNKLPQYGSGTFTGTAVYYLAVSASGDVIETAPPGGFTRPGSATTVTYDTYFSGVNWSINSTAGGTPTANGNLSVNSTTPASVDTIKIYKNNSSGTNYSTVLENLAVSGSITLSRINGGLGTATYKVTSVTDNTTYVTLAVQDATGASGTYDNGITTVDVDSDYEYELSTGYNRLDVTNSSGQSQGFRLAPPTGASAGDKVIVELLANASSANNIIVKYVLRSGTPSFIKVSNLYSIGDSTPYAISIDNNDVAYLEFTVFDYGSVTGLLPTGAQQVLYA